MGRSGPFFPGSDPERCGSMSGAYIMEEKKFRWPKPFSCQSKEINAMQSHRTSLQPSAYEMHTHLAHALVRYLDLSSPKDMMEYGLTSIADLVDLISRFTTNTVALTTSSLSPIGACVSPPIALLNHSCDPNVVMVFPRTSADPRLQEPLLHVVAIKAINSGEELLTSYIDTTLPSEERRKTLEETYCFDCKCSLCMPNTRVVDPREALLCPTKKHPTKKACDGLCQIPKEATAQTRCSVCQKSYNAAEIVDAIAISNEGLVKSKELQYKDPERAMRLTSNLIGILTSAGLAPGAHPLLALSRLHSALLVENLPDPNIANVALATASSEQDCLLMNLGMSTQAAIATPQQAEESKANHLTSEEKKRAEEAQQKLDDAIRAALRTSTGVASVLVPGHPLRGLALAELGKLLCVDEPVPLYLGTNKQRGVYPPSGPGRLRLGKECLIHSRSELMVGFGGANEGGELGRQVREWLVGVEKELEAWTVGLQSV
ncbi:hypothetical protein APHAL10511_003099 [Amanita phalloides]|nr:hypothetical protein APHAL10511_003099 [Amanita phalloides]